MARVGGETISSAQGAVNKLSEEIEDTARSINALAENLILAMEQNDIPTGAQNRLIKRLLPLYPDIRNL
jgi:hemoglobin